MKYRWFVLTIPVGIAFVWLPAHYYTGENNAHESVGYEESIADSRH